MRHSCHILAYAPGGFGLLGLLGALSLFLGWGCSSCESSTPPPPAEVILLSQCEVRFADETGKLLEPQRADCPGLRMPDRVSGAVMRLITADGKALGTPITRAVGDADRWRFGDREGACLAGLYARLHELRVLLGERGWPVEQEEPLAVLYPFNPPGMTIPSQWRIDASLPQQALLVPTLCAEGEKEPVLAPGQAARAGAVLLLNRHSPDRSDTLDDPRAQRLARNGRYVLVQGFGLYIGAVAAGTLSYMDALTPPGDFTPTRVPPVDKETLARIVTEATETFNPAPLSMNLAACLWEARSSVRKEDRHLVDREAVEGFWHNEPFLRPLVDPIPVLNQVAVRYTPVPRKAFCTCLKTRALNLSLRLGACLPYTQEGGEE